VSLYYFGYHLDLCSCHTKNAQIVSLSLLQLLFAFSISCWLNFYNKKTYFLFMLNKVAHFNQAHPKTWMFILLTTFQHNKKFHLISTLWNNIHKNTSPHIYKLSTSLIHPSLSPTCFSFLKLPLHSSIPKLFYFALLANFAWSHYVPPPSLKLNPSTTHPKSSKNNSKK